jgi:hypothetical protein
VAGRIYPRILIYAVYVTALIAAYTVLAGADPVTLLLTVLIAAPLWIESFLEYRQLRKRWEA